MISLLPTDTMYEFHECFDRASLMCVLFHLFCESFVLDKLYKHHTHFSKPNTAICEKVE